MRSFEHLVLDSPRCFYKGTHNKYIETTARSATVVLIDVECCRLVVVMEMGGVQGVKKLKEA